VGEEESSYAGRWVARLRGRIVAQGGTPEQARRAAQSRYKEIPEIVFMQTQSPLIFTPLLDSVRKALPSNPSVYLVGGAVRDAFLGRSTHDLDFTLQGGAIKLARRVADKLKADFYPLDPERDTGRVVLTEEDGSHTFLDFASFRGTSASMDPGQGLETDLTGRDFTVNAIALNLLDNTIHDPLSGIVDLKEKRLRACAPGSIKDDPLRILRAIRLAAAYGFHILPETRRMMKDAAGLLENVSSERLRDELFRILDGPRPEACIRSLEVLGTLEKILPELVSLKGVEQIPPHVHDVWEHTLSVVGHLEKILAVLEPESGVESFIENRNPSDWFSGLLMLKIGRYRQDLSRSLSVPLVNGRTLRSLLFMAALYHDAAKPQTREMGEAGKYRFWGHDQQGAELAAKRARLLALSNEEIRLLDTIIRGHMRILFLTNRLLQENKPPSRRAIYRFFRDLGPAGVELCLLALADLRGTYEQTLPQNTWEACLEVVRMMLEAWFEKREREVAPVPLVDGDDLINEFALKPGPQIGRLIETIREAQAVGEISTREQALELAKTRLDIKLRKR
jgi:tRNA nucleotidyltransferase/poly(A) polymerase